jgi:hypothetical protein
MIPVRLTKTNQNPVSNFAEGQFLTKKNSIEKWRERCFDSILHTVLGVTTIKFFAIKYLRIVEDLLHTL